MTDKPIIQLLNRYKKLSKSDLIGQLADWFNVTGEDEFEYAKSNNIIKQSDHGLWVLNNEESKCPDCGEDVALSGDYGRADVGKKKKKRFEFNETLDEHWQSITEVLNQRKLAKIWGELKPSQRRDLLKKLKVDTKLADLDFKDLSDANKTTLSVLDKTEFATALSVVLGVGLAGLALNILDAPIDKPVSKIKDEPIPKDDPVNIKTDDRQPSFKQPSSFVGQVEYYPEDLSMEIVLNGKLYAFCNVSERLFDSFEGAGSKGAFFNREIKTLHDC